MTAKWPSWLQFQGISIEVERLKTKVSGLLNSAGTGTAASPAPHQANRDQVGNYAYGASGQTVTGNTLLFRWKHYSIAPAGFTIGADITLDDIEEILFFSKSDDIYNINSVNYSPDIAMVVKRDTRNDIFFDFPQAIPTLTEGFISIKFKSDITVAADETPYARVAPGTSVEMQDSVGNTLPYVPRALLTVLRESDVMVRPQYIAPYFGVPYTDQLQIIWPDGGQPSLVIVGADGSTFYTALTPGLPQ